MELYHVINRGVDKRTIVEDDEDRVRFVHDLFFLNNRRHVDPNHRFKQDTPPVREKLVSLHAWCLMSNHYHLLISELVEGGMSLFMRKLNMGYAKYFNEKYQRTGYLWQGVFRRQLISREAHFLRIPYYIHLNPLDFSYPAWRRGEVRNVRKALEHLDSYRWSSYLDYMGKQNFPSVIDARFLSDVLGSRTAQEREIASLIGSTDSGIENLSTQLEWE